MMSPMEALKLALEKEKASVKMYNKFYSDYPEVKDTFLFLLNEEEKHQKMIEEKIVELRIK